MLMVKTVVRPSLIDGLGLFAKEEIPAGTVIWEFVEKFDITYTDEEFESLPGQAQPHVRKYSYFCPEMCLWVLCGDDARLMNHATLPNTFEQPGYRTVAARDIAAGEELTCDYTQFDARSFIDGDFHPNGSESVGFAYTAYTRHGVVS